MHIHFVELVKRDVMRGINTRDRGGERESERQRQTDRDRQRDRSRERHTQTQTGGGRGAEGVRIIYYNR